MPRTTDVAIVGGGVIGCSIAYHLAKLGIKSTVFEQRRLASGASGATAGVVGPLWHIEEFSRATLELGLRSLDTFPKLAQELVEAGGDPEFRQTGLLWIALDEEDVRTLQQGLAWQGELGLGVRWLERDAVLQREPHVNPQVQGGVLSPNEGHVRGQAYVGSLAHAASRLGAVIREGVEVGGLEIDGDTVTGVRTTTDTYYADHTVLAAGPWTGIQGRWLPEGLPVRPVKGQRILLRRAGLVPHSPVHGSGGYVIPQVDGSLLVAATREESLFDQTIDHRGRHYGDGGKGSLHLPGAG